jgi:hypothetical protein
VWGYRAFRSRGQGRTLSSGRFARHGCFDPEAPSGAIAFDPAPSGTRQVHNNRHIRNRVCWSWSSPWRLQRQGDARSSIASLLTQPMTLEQQSLKRLKLRFKAELSASTDYSIRTTRSFRAQIRRSIGRRRRIFVIASFLAFRNRSSTLPLASFSAPQLTGKLTQPTMYRSMFRDATGARR